jgi:hypothetical protein
VVKAATITDPELDALVAKSRDLPHELDWAIWEAQRGKS